MHQNKLLSSMEQAQALSKDASANCRDALTNQARRCMFVDTTAVMIVSNVPNSIL